MTSNGINGTWNTTGIVASAGYGDKYFYNTVYLTGPLSNTANPNSAAFANGNGDHTAVSSNIDVRNNVFNLSGIGGTGSGNVWAVYTKSTNIGTTIMLQNNNDLRSAVTGGTNNVGFYNGTSYVTLANWQAATGLDANSISVDPLLNSNTLL